MGLSLRTLFVLLSLGKVLSFFKTSKVKKLAFKCCSVAGADQTKAFAATKAEEIDTRA
jgi:hypothetical protein